MICAGCNIYTAEMMDIPLSFLDNTSASESLKSPDNLHQKIKIFNFGKKNTIGTMVCNKNVFHVPVFVVKMIPAELGISLQLPVMYHQVARARKLHVQLIVD